MLLATLARSVPHDHNMFIVQATVVTIVNYDRNKFIVQATRLFILGDNNEMVIYSAYLNINIGWKNIRQVTNLKY
jgi:hypothetical protein